MCTAEQVVLITRRRTDDAKVRLGLKAGKLGDASFQVHSSLLKLVGQDSSLLLLQPRQMTSVSRQKD